MLCWMLALSLANAGAFHPDRLLVRGSDLAVGDEIGPGLRVERALRVPGWYVVRVPSRRPDTLVDLVRTDPRVEIAELDGQITLTRPWRQEPDFDQEWFLENRPSRLGTRDADIDARDAWAQGATGAGVVVAVIDTGVDYTHRDLAPRMWTNPGEIPGNGIDDDENGYVDDIHGIDAGTGSGDPQDPDGHGTAVAGIIAAEPNGWSVVGIAPDAQIMGVRMFGGGGFNSAAADGIVYAAEMGADVLSMSWHNGQLPSSSITDALQLAVDRGALPVISAGNTPVNADKNGYYPATTALTAILSVCASTRHDERVHFPGVWGSAWGLHTVDLCAPGEGIATVNAGGGYDRNFGGTSAAAPVVSGSAALVWSAAPQLTALEVREALVRTVDRNGSRTVTGGRVNAGAAVRYARTGRAPLSILIDAARTQPRDTPITLGVTGPAATYTWYFPDTGRFSVGREVTHRFETPGLWTVVVEGVDEEGVTGRAQHVVEVAIDWVAHPLAEPIASLHGVPQPIALRPLELPDNVRWTRLHFDRIDLPSRSWDDQDGYIAINDVEGLWLWSFTGSDTDVWTPPLPGNAFGLQWAMDNPNALDAFGWRIDAIQIWHPGVPRPDPPTAPDRQLSGGLQCGSTRGGTGTAFLLAFLLLRRRSPVD